MNSPGPRRVTSVASRSGLSTSRHTAFSTAQRRRFSPSGLSLDNRSRIVNSPCSSINSRSTARTSSRTVWALRPGRMFSRKGLSRTSNGFAWGPFISTNCDPVRIRSRHVGDSTRVAGVPVARDTVRRRATIAECRKRVGDVLDRETRVTGRSRQRVSTLARHLQHCASCPRWRSRFAALLRFVRRVKTGSRSSLGCRDRQRAPLPFSPLGTVV